MNDAVNRCAKCGIPVDGAFCSECGHRVGGDFFVKSLAASLVEAPISFLRILPLLPRYTTLARRIVAGSIDLKFSLQVYGVCIAIAAFCAQRVANQNHPALQAVQGSAYIWVQLLLMPVFFYPIHHILSKRSHVVDMGQPLAAYMIYTGAAGCIAFAGLAIGANTGVRDAHPIAIVISLLVVGLGAGCLKHIYDAGIARIKVLFVVTVITLFGPQIMAILLMSILLPIALTIMSAAKLALS